MAGGQRYGKPVDIWAVGFIMYELIAGKHPLWKKGDDNITYKHRATNFKGLRYGHRFNKFS
jgi:serine/threonine protein kinase